MYTILFSVSLDQRLSPEPSSSINKLFMNAKNPDDSRHLFPTCFNHEYLCPIDWASFLAACYTPTLITLHASGKLNGQNIYQTFMFGNSISNLLGKT